MSTAELVRSCKCRSFVRMVGLVDSLPSPFPPKLGEFLAELRERAALSQEALAEVLGHGQTWVSRIESGQTGVSVEVLLAWLRAVGVGLVDVADKLERLDPDASRSSIWRREA